MGRCTVVFTFDPDFDGAHEAVITLTAKDDHDRTTEKKFTVAIASAYSAFWATLAGDDDIGAQSSTTHYVVGGKDMGKKWKVTDNLDDGTFQVGDSLNLETGVYTVPIDGLYMVNAHVRIDKASNQFKLFINIKHKGIDSAQKAVTDLQSGMKSTYTTLKVATTFKLEAGDELSVDLNVWGHNSFRIQYETGWGVALVEDEDLNVN